MRGWIGESGEVKGVRILCSSGSVTQWENSCGKNIHKYVEQEQGRNSSNNTVAPGVESTSPWLNLRQSVRPSSNSKPGWKPTRKAK